MTCLPVGPFRANCYLLQADGHPQGVVIDPGGESDFLIRQCGAMGMTPVAVLLTHGHFDHVGGVAGLMERWPNLQVYLHQADVGPTPRFQWRPTPGAIFYGEGDRLSLAALPFLVLHTPGHSPGSVTLRCGDLLFTGDTLFCGAVGRTDFPGSDPAQMAASLRRLAGLEGNLTVHPGHYQSTTLNHERQTNPFLQAAWEETP